MDFFILNYLSQGQAAENNLDLEATMYEKQGWKLQDDNRQEPIPVDDWDDEEDGPLDDEDEEDDEYDYDDEEIDPENPIE